MAEVVEWGGYALAAWVTGYGSGYAINWVWKLVSVVE